MQALLYYGQRDIRLEDVSLPSLSNTDDVLIKVTKAGISQTQINEFANGPFVINSTPRPLINKQIPLIPCQEYGGVVVKVGHNVPEDLIGKQVAVLPLVNCKKCSHCLDGNEEMCDQIAYHGFLGLDGGFCEYSVVNKNNIIEIQDSSMLTFVEPLLVAIHSANRANIKTNKIKKVLVIGAGAVGCSVAIVWSKLFGCNVTIYDILTDRLARAEKIGIKTFKATDKIIDKYDCVVDAAGKDFLSNLPAFNSAFNYLKKGGTFIGLGTYFSQVSFDFTMMIFNQQNIISSIAYNNYDVEILKQSMSKINIDFSPLIAEIELEDIVEGYLKAEANKRDFTRLVIRC